MTFENLDSETGLTNLNQYLADKSYIEGYTPTQKDVATWNALSLPINAEKFIHLARWYRHIASYSDQQRSLFPGNKVFETEEEKPVASEEAEADSAGAEEETQETPAEETPAEETQAEETQAEEIQVEAVQEAADDDFELFGDDPDADAEHEAWIEERAREQNEKKAATGKVLIAKSMVTFDVKPVELETDMQALEDSVRSIEMEGLEWKVSELVDVCYGIRKLQIRAVIVDDLASVDDVAERIEAFDELVQSVDIAAFNKL